MCDVMKAALVNTLRYFPTMNVQNTVMRGLLLAASAVVATTEQSQFVWI